MNRLLITCTFLNIRVYAEDNVRIGLPESNPDIPIPDDDSVRKRHAHVEKRGDVFVLVADDLHAKIRVGDKETSELPLKQNTVFQIGRHEFRCIKVGAPVVGPPRVDGVSEATPAKRVLVSGHDQSSLSAFYPGKRLYRIAVLAGEGVGKTCLLAALTMHRKPRKDGVSCIRIPDLIDNENINDLNREGEAVKDFYFGKSQLDEAIRLLEQGQVPEKTVDTLRARYIFDIGTPDRSRILIELIDYAGELTRPEVAADKKAERLRCILNSADGLVLLAQIPRKGRSSIEEAGELRRLAETTKLLEDIKRPVVLAVNKWDRSSPIDYSTPEKERDKLRTYLATPEGAGIQALVNAIRNAVGADCFGLFPLSAFGESELAPQSNKERPTILAPLQSFGLEDPFLWIVHKCDERTVRDFDRKVDELVPVPWKMFWGDESNNTRGAQKLNEELTLRGISNPETRETLDNAQLKLRSKIALAWGQVVAAGLALMIGIGSCSRSVRDSRIVSESSKSIVDVLSPGKNPSPEQIEQLLSLPGIRNKNLVARTLSSAQNTLSAKWLQEANKALKFKTFDSTREQCRNLHGAISPLDRSKLSDLYVRFNHWAKLIGQCEQDFRAYEEAKKSGTAQAFNKYLRLSNAIPCFMRVQIEENIHRASAIRIDRIKREDKYWRNKERDVELTLSVNDKPVPPFKFRSDENGDIMNPNQSFPLGPELNGEAIGINLTVKYLYEYQSDDKFKGSGRFEHNGARELQIKADGVTVTLKRDDPPQLPDWKGEIPPEMWIPKI